MSKLSDDEKKRRRSELKKRAQERWSTTGSKTAPASREELGIQSDATNDATEENSDTNEQQLKPHHLSKYRPEYDKMLIDHMKEGNSFWSFAAKINVNFDTLQDWSERHPSFLEARRRGEAHLLLFDETAGKAGMLGKIKGFNARVWETIVRNRWRRFYFDKREIKLEFSRPEELRGLSDDELTQLLKEQLSSSVDESMSEFLRAGREV